MNTEHLITPEEFNSPEFARERERHYPSDKGWLKPGHEACDRCGTRWPCVTYRLMDFVRALIESQAVVLNSRKP